MDKFFQIVLNIKKFNSTIFKWMILLKLKTIKKILKTLLQKFDKNIENSFRKYG